MDLRDPNYDPDRFIDWVRKVMRARSDRRLAAILAMSPAVLCRIRASKAPVTSRMLIAIHEYTGMRTREIKAEMFLVKEKK